MKIENSLKIVNWKLKIALLCFAFFLSSVPVFAGVISMPPNNLGLVGYWSFNEGSGTVAGDHSGNGNHGSLVGSPEWINGKLGKALIFNGTDQGISIPMSASLQWNGNSEWTLAGWAYLHAYNTTDPFSYIVAQNTLRISLGVTSDGAMQTSGFGRSSTSRVGSNVPLNQWVHLVVVGDATSRKHYMNGVLVEEWAETGTLNINSQDWGIGKHPTQATRYWDGMIDDVRVYNRALAESEVWKLYQSGSARIGVSTAGQMTDGLVGHWTFDGQDISGSTAIDRSGQGNDATLISAVPTMGKIGQGVGVNPTGGYVRITENANLNGLNTNGQDLSLSIWVNADLDSTPTSMIFGRDHSSTAANWTGIYTDVAGNIRAIISDGSGASQTTGVAFPSGEGWNHWTMTYNHTNIILYKNGVEVANNGATRIVDLETAGRSWDINRRYENTNGVLNGVVDDARIYNRALSAQEVTQLYRLGQATINKTSETGVKKSNLVGHWTFDGPTISGTTVTDVSGNGNDGTINGSVTPVIGKIGQGLEFGGDLDYIDIGNVVMNNSNSTVAFWLNLTDFNTGNMVIGRSNTHYLLVRSDLQSNPRQIIARYPSGVSNVIFYNDLVLEPSRWYHIALVFNELGTGPTWYTDGVPTNTSSSLTSTSATMTWQYLGRWNTGYLNGKLDDVRIYDSALSDQEVRQLYQMGR